MNAELGWCSVKGAMDVGILNSMAMAELRRGGVSLGPGGYWGKWMAYVTSDALCLPLFDMLS